MRESGISLYFNQDRIRIRHRTIKELDYPEHIHLRINEEKKYLFIEKCARDKDSFRIEYSDGKIKGQGCFISAKAYLRYLAAVIGVPVNSPSLRFYGYLMPDGTVFIDLNRYEVIQQYKNGAKESSTKGS